MCSPASPRISTRLVHDVADWCNRQRWPLVLLRFGSRAINSLVRTIVGPGAEVDAGPFAAYEAEGSTNAKALACFRKERRWMALFMVKGSLQRGGRVAQLVSGKNVVGWLCSW